MTDATPDITVQRRQALAARRQLTDRQRQAFSQRAAYRLARLPAVRRARRIGLYWPLASEIDPRPLADRLTRRPSPPPQWFFPRVAHERLLFVAVADCVDRRGWQQSALGVHEPPGPGLPVDRLDVLVMPLAGFDAGCHRIGLGGGFYDRTLAAVAGRAYRRPQLVGLAFEAQRLARIVPQPWDIGLDAVVSERAVYRSG